MRGGFVHNHVLLAPCAEALRRQGATVTLEHPVRNGRASGAVDVFAELHGLRIVIEAERSAERVGNDVRKAADLRAHVLLIVVPTSALARSATRRLAEANDSDAVGVLKLCLPLGPALRRLANICHLMTLRNVATTFNPKIRPAAGGLSGELP